METLLTLQWIHLMFICILIIICLYDFQLCIWCSSYIHIADAANCTCYKFHVLQILCVANGTCCKLTLFQIACVANCRCCNLHMLQIESVANCMCCKLQVLQIESVANCMCWKLQTTLGLLQDAGDKNTKWVRTHGRTDEGTGGLLELLSLLKRQCANETYLQGGVEKVSKVAN